MIENPPYTIAPDILFRIEQIGEAIGRAEAAGLSQDLRLRRINRIRTICGSLASDQVSDQVARLLEALRTGPKTAAELMAAMGLSHRPTFARPYRPSWWK